MSKNVTGLQIGLSTINRSVVYVIQAGNTDFYKIGVTTNVDRRIKELQTGSPHALRIVRTQEGNIQTEQELQKKYVEYKTRNEWFEFPDIQIILREFDLPAFDREQVAIRQLVYCGTGILTRCAVGLFFDAQLLKSVSRYQIMPDDGMLDFWWHHVEHNRQWFDSKAEAVVAFISAYLAYKHEVWIAAPVIL